MPCFAFEGECSSGPVGTSDGRILIQVFPFYVGSTHVFVHGPGFPVRHVGACDSPSFEACTYMVETRRAGVYIVTVEFGPTTNGGLLLEVLTPA